jgi:hypothetical protein
MELIPTDTVNLGGFWQITAVNKNATGETLQRKPWTKNNRNKENGTTHNCVIIHEFFVCYEVTLNYAYKKSSTLATKKIKKAS